MPDATAEVHLWRRSHAEVFGGRPAPARGAPAWPSERLIAETVALQIPGRGPARIARGLYGKPQLLWPYRDWQLSVSHTARHWWCALAQDAPLGCDAEQLGAQLRDLAGLPEWTPSERRYLERDGTGLERAARLWTLKEAYAKAFGYGARMGFAEFGFRLGRSRIAVRDSDALRHALGAGLVCLLLAAGDERLAVAVRLAPQHSALRIVMHGAGAALLAHSGRRALRQIAVFSN